MLHSGWTLRLRFYYPDWFLNPQIVLQADDYLRISDAEVTAFDDGVLMLRETDQERPFNDWIVALPIRVEQHLRPDDVEFIARATEGHDGQFTSFFTVTLRGHHLGRRSAATPSRIRIIPAASPNPVPSAGFPNMQSPGGIPAAVPPHIPNPPRTNPPEPVNPAPMQAEPMSEGSGLDPPHVAGDPMNATPASIHRDLSAMSDSELHAFDGAFDGIMRMPNINLTESERSQAVLIAAMTQHEIARRRASQGGYNP